MQSFDVNFGDVLPAAFQRGQRLVRAKQLLTGHWFHDLMVSYLRARARVRPDEHVVESDPMGAAARIIRKASAEAALLGTGAAAVTTGATAWTAQSNGVAGVVAVPAAGAAMLGDMLMRALVNLRMTCDIAELFDIHFDADDPADLARLHAVAHRVVALPSDASERGHQALDALTDLDPERVSRAIGFSANSETVLRNVVPVVGLVSSSVTSYRLTHRLGKAALQYSRARAAFRDALAPFARKVPSEVLDLLIEGIWFAFTADGQLDESDAAILAFVLHTRPDDVRQRLLDKLRDDEAGWIGRLNTVPHELREDFYRVLCVATAVNSQLLASGLRFAARAAEALGVPARVQELEALAASFWATGHAPH